MEYFGFLIDKDNLNSKINMEYIYMLDIVWEPNKLGDKPIKFGTIMVDVVKFDSGKYQFTCKETGERLTSNYGWSLAENTPDNIKQIELYDKEYIKFKEHEIYLETLKNNINTLNPKK